MDGMQMMMKALGVDPAAIMQAAGTFQEGLKKVMDDLETIKAQQQLILHHLSERYPTELDAKEDDTFKAISHG